MVFIVFESMLERSQLGGRGCNVHLHILYRKGLWDMFLKIGQPAW